MDSAKFNALQFPGTNHAYRSLSDNYYWYGIGRRRKATIDFTLSRYESVFVPMNTIDSSPGILSAVDHFMRCEASRRVVFVDGLNINFMRDLQELLHKRPLIHVGGIHQKNVFPDILHASDPIPVYNTGRKNIKTNSDITVIPPLTQTDIPPMYVDDTSSSPAVYPLLTVEKTSFQRDFNAILREVRVIADVESSMTTRIEHEQLNDDSYLAVVGQSMFCALAHNELFQEMVFAVERANAITGYSETFKIIRRYFEKNWYPRMGLNVPKGDHGSFVL